MKPGVSVVGVLTGRFGASGEGGPHLVVGDGDRDGCESRERPADMERLPLLPGEEVEAEIGSLDVAPRLRLPGVGDCLGGPHFVLGDGVRDRDLFRD